MACDRDQLAISGDKIGYRRDWAVACLAGRAIRFGVSQTDGASMDQEILQYDQIVEEALRGVVRTALAQVAALGLPEGNSLYITFRTTAAGVEIAPRLRENYPEEMTIVLEHQFWDLDVDEDAFSVKLSFDRRQEELFIPFEAILSFADPSVPFGLKFEMAALADDDGLDAETAEAEKTAKDVAPGQDRDAPDASDDAAKPEEGKTGEVVSLDQFRKK